jgi:5-methylcytosine-specific restriction endonuclease McrA
MPRLQGPPQPNDVVERIARIVDALMAGDNKTSQRELAPIARSSRVTTPLEVMPTRTLGPRPRGVGLKTRDPGKNVKAAVFVRDSFTCCYCDRLTIPLDILKLVSHRFGDDFGYQKNWKPPTHRAYWDISTSLDHVIPVSVGRDWNSVSNLATACYRCQEQQNNRALDTLGWGLKHSKSKWDGLTKSYEELWVAVQPPRGDHRAWIAAFRGAWDAREAGRSFASTANSPAATARSHNKIKQVPAEKEVSRDSPAPTALSRSHKGLSEGMFVRARLPGKKSRRSYRVLKAAGDNVVLQELWRGESSRRWTAGRQIHRVAPRTLGGLEILPLPVPKPGDPSV